MGSRPLRQTLGIALVLLGLSACSSADATTAAAETQETQETRETPETETAAPTATAETAVPTATAAPTAIPTAVAQPAATPPELRDGSWREVTAEAPWPARAGLRVLERDGAFYLLGGRTPNDSTIPGDSRIWSDVWRSDDRGASWENILATDGDHWSPRAYFQAVEKDDAFFVIGGQDYGLEENPFCELLAQGLKPPPGLGIDPDAPCPEFLPTSQFFNDVWRSDDGVVWEPMTESAPWEARAGLSAAVLGEHIYVLGGSQNDDSSIIGAGGPQRIYFNDVWRSSDGAQWEQMTESAPWEPRAGAAVVTVGEHLYLLGGEDGFTCEPLPDCEPPYFNDVWRTIDGTDWELVSEAAPWTPRPGHVCKLVDEQIVCFGGFGLIENPLDVWATADGRSWQLLQDAPWNAAVSEDAKYDFDAVAVAAEGDRPAAIFTFGGDRETFDFADPENWLRIDNDVWEFSLQG